MNSNDQGSPVSGGKTEQKTRSRTVGDPSSTPASSTATLEHVNVTVSNPEQTARLMCELFDWHIRWEGPSKMGGRTVHVGTKDAYVAVYTTPAPVAGQSETHLRGGLNHIGVEVEDLDLVEARVKAAGYTPFNHADYEPGRRFYFLDSDEIEFEIVSYR